MAWCFFFFNAAAPSAIYTLSLHDALPICSCSRIASAEGLRMWLTALARPRPPSPARGGEMEEHTSELQSRENLVCRLLLEKKKPAPLPRHANIVHGPAVLVRLPQTIAPRW